MSMNFLSTGLQSIDPNVLVVLQYIAGILTGAHLLILLIGRIKPGSGLSIELNNRIWSWWLIAITTATAIVGGTHLCALFFCCIAFYAMREFMSCDDGDASTTYHKYVRLISELAAPLTFIATTLWPTGASNSSLIPFIYLLAYTWTDICFADDTKGFLSRVSSAVWGTTVVVFGLSHLVSISAIPRQGSGLILFLAFLTEINDVNAYTVGKICGRHKIMPWVSPKKTWEGFIGGSAITVGMGLYCRELLTPFSAQNTVIIVSALCVVGFFGDMVFSAAKRDRGIKDYGSFLPGHGGLLDRIDSITFTAPVFFHLIHALK